ncbi:SLAM family member 5-like [Salarias fasciatus]|uniref:SLAM family member 5-like n=1 Tax=Salarias fasciatus TaxID=181472 RepID=UPI001176EA3B|nr:SLAM family member 5-like [Salarias fasciatus]
MAAGRLPGLSCFFTFSVLGLLGVCFPHDVEASREESVIHKNVGETVEFKSGLLSTEGVTLAEWKYGGVRIASYNGPVKENHQFEDRIQINPQNFSLTVRNLTPQDSGDYHFVSEVNDMQRPTITFTLRVHEPIKKPLLSINVTRDALNQSCTVFLECSTSVHDVSYSWTVGSQKKSGSKLQHVIRPQDGEIRFTCTISDQFTEESSSINQTCSNDTFTDKPGTFRFWVEALVHSNQQTRMKLNFIPLFFMVMVPSTSLFKALEEESALCSE